jgi:hypothetical protein
MHACGSATYLGIIFLVAAALVCVAAAGQIAATRDEEAGGHVDHLVTRRVGRLHWLAVGSWPMSRSSSWRAWSAKPPARSRKMCVIIVLRGGESMHSQIPL